MAERINELGGVVPGSMGFRPDQYTLQPPKDQSDVVAVVRGLIHAENLAIRRYERLLATAHNADAATMKMVVGALAGSQRRRRLQHAFRLEYEGHRPP